MYKCMDTDVLSLSHFWSSILHCTCGYVIWDDVEYWRYNSSRWYCYFRKLKVWKYACLACMFKNLDQSVNCQIIVVFIYHIWILLSILGLRLKQWLERHSVHLFTMRFWWVSSFTVLFYFCLLFNMVCCCAGGSFIIIIVFIIVFDQLDYIFYPLFRLDT